MVISRMSSGGPSCSFRTMTIRGRADVSKQGELDVSFVSQTRGSKVVFLSCLWGGSIQPIKLVLKRNERALAHAN
jgi:hypothetical protein